MKWKKGGSTENFPEKTFLVIKNDLNSTSEKKPQRVKSKSAADTGTWPPKLKKNNSYTGGDRPKTANLEKPNILDPKLVNKLDMSLLTKELLSEKLSGEVTLQPAAADKLKFAESKLSNIKPKYRQSIDQLGYSMKLQQSPTRPTNLPFNSAIKRRNSDLKRLDDNNNKNPPGNSRTLTSLSSLSSVRAVKFPVEVEMFTNSTVKTEPPEPCKTCGRPDQPERFHSHPKSLLSPPAAASTSKSKESTGKKTIQKPVALNFRSEKNRNKRSMESKVTPPEVNNNDQTESSSRPNSSKKRPRTVTCYICGREFGTASFPIHEPHCMRRWERENNALPPSQKRPVPQRPQVSVDHDEWNATAWELSQMQLVPCGNCGRTFLPDRLLVHERSCKSTAKSTSNKQTDKPRELNNNNVNTSNNNPGFTTILCQICGRNFGTRSIKIHEPQCLKRWQAENEGKKSAREQTSGSQRKFELKRPEKL